MSYICRHHLLRSECRACPSVNYGYSEIAETPPWRRISTEPHLNLDRFGMPRDFASYMWLVYRQRVSDDSPMRHRFLNGRSDGLFLAMSYDTR